MSKAITPEAIDAALKKFAPPATLPPLLASSPDELLIAHLAFSSQMTTLCQRQIDQEYQRAKSRQHAPVQMLARRTDAFWIAARTIREQNPELGSTSLQGWRGAIQMLRISLEALEELTTWCNRWDLLSDEERRLESASEENRAAFESRPIQPAGPIATATDTWHGFLERLQSRGIMVSPGPADDLLLTNGARLTSDERMILAGNKPSILATLNSGIERI